MDKKKKPKKKYFKKYIENSNELKVEDELVINHDDPEGEIIFLNKTITPGWLVNKLNNQFIFDMNEDVKCRDLKV
jgi:hypothetical protein